MITLNELFLKSATPVFVSSAQKDKFPGGKLGRFSASCIVLAVFVIVRKLATVFIVLFARQ